MLTNTVVVVFCVQKYVNAPTFVIKDTAVVVNSLGEEFGVFCNINSIRFFVLIVE